MPLCGERCSLNDEPDQVGTGFVFIRRLPPLARQAHPRCTGDACRYTVWTVLAGLLPVMKWATALLSMSG